MRSASEAGDGVPAFLAKLWKLVDESRTNHLISWAQGGNTFVIKNQIDFARKLLPLYYKHNNMASFIRQLNMYGFHKVITVDNGSLKCENDEIQFSHPCFLKGHAYLLKHIKRKIANPKNHTTNEEKALLKPETMTKVLTDVKQMKGRQESLDARFSIMKHENEALWREVALLRQKHIKQQQIVNNLIQFIMSIVQNSRNGPLKTGVKRRYQLMINNAAHNNEEENEIRSNKSPRVNLDLELDEDNDFIIPDMTDDEGPIIHELKEQEHNSDGSASFSLLSPGSENVATSPAGEVLSPDTSLIQDVFEDDMGEDIDDSIINISKDTNNESLLNTSSKSTKKSSKGLKKSQKKDVKADEAAFSLTSPQASATLPTDIFESDEAASQDSVGVSLSDVEQQATLSALKSGDIFINSPSASIDDEYINNVVYGNYNPNINITSTSKNKNKSKNGKVKSDLRNIKQELPTFDDEVNADNMVLALSQENSRPTLSRFNSVEDVDDHLSSMQSDIESIRDLLSRENCTLDANTLLGLFGSDEPFYGLSINPMDISLDKAKEAGDEATNQIISYVPPSSNIDFQDLELGDDLTTESLDDIRASPIDDSCLNTPQVQMPEPKFQLRQD